MLVNVKYKFFIGLSHFLFEFLFIARDILLVVLPASPSMIMKMPIVLAAERSGHILLGFGLIVTFFLLAVSL